MSMVFTGPAAARAESVAGAPRAEPGFAPVALLVAASSLALSVVLARTAATLALATGAALTFGTGLLALAHALPSRAQWLRLVFVALLAWLLNAVFTGGPAAELGGLALPVSAAGARIGTETAARLVALVLLFQGVARAVSPFELVRLVERGLSPLRRLGIRGEGLSVVTLVALRMAPSLAQEARRLSLQRALRGAWPGPSAPWRERRRRLHLGLRQLPGVLTPLVLLTLRRAEELAWALPARYYGLGPRTPPPVRAWRARDWSALAGAFVLLGWSAWSRTHG